jgi:hypothetical protein
MITENYLRPKAELIKQNKVKCINVFGYSKNEKIINNGIPLRYYYYNKEGEVIKKAFYSKVFREDYDEDYFDSISISKRDEKGNMINEFYTNCRGLDGEHPKEFKYLVFRLDDKNDKLIEYKEVNSERKTVLHEYFRHSRIVENEEYCIITNKKKQPTGRILTNFNDSGKKILILYFNKYDDVTSKSVRNYDLHNNKILELNTGIMKLDHPVKNYRCLYSSRKEFDYDGDNNKTEERFYAIDDKLNERRIYEYDHNKKLIQESYFSEYNTLLFSVFYQYDENDFLKQKTKKDYSVNIFKEEYFQHSDKGLLMKYILNDENYLRYEYEYEYF